jgi:hypothetical protein
MAEPAAFKEIDFEQIEYRNEYQHTKSVFAALFSVLFLLPQLAAFALEGGWRSWLGGAGLLGYGSLALTMYIKLRSRLLVTGSGITLRRPLLKDVEIAYSEMSEITFDDGWLGPGKMMTTLNLTEAQPRWEIKTEESGGKFTVLELSEPLSDWAAKHQSFPVTSKAGVTIHSRGGKKKIKLDQSLEYFEAFCNDLLKRHQLALERYQGYAKGTTLRQPERYLETKAKLREKEPSRQLKN